MFAYLKVVFTVAAHDDSVSVAQKLDAHNLERILVYVVFHSADVNHRPAKALALSVNQNPLAMSNNVTLVSNSRQITVATV